MNIKQLHHLFLESNNICTDTRKLQKDDMFFALKGDHFNGNTFAQDALKNGAKYAVIDEAAYQHNAQCILVKDVLKTLQQLANYHRNYLNLNIIALTGSNGKTTTKELINAVLSKKFNTTATQGNLNNHIGVPLTLLSMTKETEIGIVEMGANHQKEIEFLCTIAEPNFGYITNFGKAHLEGFGGVEGVIKGKSELYTFLMQHNGLIFYNGDDEKQLELLANYHNTYGFGATDGLSIEFLEANPMVRLRFREIVISSNLIGQYNFNNIAAAVCMGHYFNVDGEQIKTAIENYIPENNRSQIIHRGNNKIILDAYNANPSSMQAALENFSNLRDAIKIPILGDMYELGDNELEEHKAIAKLAAHLNFTSVYLIGDLFFQAQIHDSNLIYFKTFDEFVQHLKESTIENTTLLIKASRGMALERTLEHLK